ncbi:MAG: FtsQ-type POTRA domain-containing protein [Candidatus Carbobacillus altaicus]|uniref:POTRA domain-containing protein n=1 Tax=Candidatus Carbonibacillus altaicus TaxID=2163959 RepID=A0A2R6Y349_9BACL|nr:FtsQ-type POTRA domain-containing protein [Candidatus Carbobacillus altaicus]PTQ57101.1 MAG: hypothetical protein BSOLF_2252 [Candidatus Carbobacillus altaicus]
MRLKRWIGPFFLLLLLFAYLRSPYAHIDSLTVTGTTRLSEEEILNWAGVKPGDSLVFWWPGVRDRLEQHEVIKRATLSWSFPNHFHLYIEEWPIYGLLFEEGRSTGAEDGSSGTEASEGRGRWLILENGHCTPPRTGEALAGYPLIRLNAALESDGIEQASGTSEKGEPPSKEASTHEAERLQNVCREGAKLLGALDPDTYALVSEVIWDDPAFAHLIHLYLTTGDEIFVEQERSTTLIPYYSSLRTHVPKETHGRFFLLENGSYFEPYDRQVSPKKP